MAENKNCGCGQDPCITYGVIVNPLEKGRVDEYDSYTLAAQAAQARADSSGETSYMWTEGGKHKVSIFHPGNVDPTRVKSYSPILKNPHSSNTSLMGIVSYLNKLTKGQIKAMSKQDSVDVNSRLSLMVFIRDWRVDDPTHEEYMRGVADSHKVDEALQAGDLLNFLMVGGKELRLYEGDEYVPKTRWTEYLGPFLKKMPVGKGVQDLIGVHSKVLSLLPMKTYNHYTIAEIFADHPELKTSLLGEPVLLAPIEFKALSALQTIVDSGSIGQFKLALSKGDSKGIRELAQARGGDIGGIILSAFKLASAAVSAFKVGEYKTAKELMDDLQRQYGIGSGSFSSAEESMFIATLSSIGKYSKNKDQKLKIKGNARQVLMTLDTTFSTDMVKKATPAQAAVAAKVVAQETAWSYDKVKATRGGSKNAGTNGIRNFTTEHSSGGSNNSRTSKENVSIISTDWLAIFYAIANAEKFIDKDLKALPSRDIGNVYEGVFTADRSSVGKAARGSKKGRIVFDQVKNVLNAIEKDSWRPYVQRGSGKNTQWKVDELQRDYPKNKHPGLYGGGGGGGGVDITQFAGNEPMYRFLVYSDLQNPNASILGNFMPKGTLTVIIRAAKSQDVKENFLPFEADMFYESFYAGDELDKLIPTITGDGEEEDPIDLQDISMSNRARRRGSRKNNPPTYTIRPGSTIVRRSDGKKFTYLSTIKADVGDGDTAPIYHVKDTKTNEESYLTNTSFKEDFVLDYNPEEGPSAYANPPSPLLPIYAGTPGNVKRNEGVIFSEVQIGRNIVKDVGEVVQSVYRGLIGGRTSIAEKRMAMAIATMQKELSDRAMEKNANAVGNLKIDYELVQGSATLTIIAHADAFVIEGISVMDRTARRGKITFDELMAMADGSYEEKSPNDLDYYSQPRDVGSNVLKEARKAAQEVANQTGKELFLYLDFVDDDIENDFANPTFSYFLIFTSNADRFSLPEYHLPNNPPFLVKPQNPRRASKKSSSKKPASGNMISIELTPRSQVQMSTAVDKADWLKAKMKEDKSGKLKALWNEYAKGDNPKPVFTDRTGVVSGDIITAIKWRGKNYKFSQAELKGGKKTNKKRRKMFPASLVKAMGGKGTYADYKGGQANMRMIYAKRIDNGRMVPFRINVPKILLRKRANKVIPKDGGHKQGVKLLLDTIKTSFGEIDLDTRFESSGGYDTYKKDRDTGEFLTDKKGKKILNVPVDRGIHLLYQVKGLDTEGAYSTNAFPAYTRGGKIVYRAMSFGGQPVDMEVNV